MKMKMIFSILLMFCLCSLFFTPIEQKVESKKVSITDTNSIENVSVITDTENVKTESVSIAEIFNLEIVEKIITKDHDGYNFSYLPDINYKYTCNIMEKRCIKCKYISYTPDKIFLC